MKYKPFVLSLELVEEWKHGWCVPTATAAFRLKLPSNVGVQILLAGKRHTSFAEGKNVNGFSDPERPIPPSRPHSTVSYAAALYPFAKNVQGPGGCSFLHAITLKDPAQNR